MNQGQDKQVGLLGATGFLGRHAAAALAEAGWRVCGFRRRRSATGKGIDEWRDASALDLAGLRAVVNLAGEPIDRRWSAANRARFAESRGGLTRRLVAALGRLPVAQRPGLLVNASAVGFYGDRGDEVLEEDSPPGTGYLAELCDDWETAAREAEGLGTRVVRLRIGVVLGRDGPAWLRMHRLFRAGLGGRLGPGRQWWPWIHCDDLAAAVLACVENPALGGPVNAVAPGPVTNAGFTRELARALGRPAVLPVPGFALKLALGGFGSALLASQRALPRALLDHGFRFRFPSLPEALAELTGTP